MSTKQVSNTPMIMGIIGFVASLPALACATMCAAVESGANSSAREMGIPGGSSFFGSWLTLMFLGAVSGLIFSFMSKSRPMLAGIVMLGSSAVILITTFFTFQYFYGLVATACYAVGGAICLAAANKNPNEI